MNAAFYLAFKEISECHKGIKSFGNLHGPFCPPVLLCVNDLTVAGSSAGAIFWVNKWNPTLHCRSIRQVQILGNCIMLPSSSIYNCLDLQTPAVPLKLKIRPLWKRALCSNTKCPSNKIALRKSTNSHSGWCDPNDFVPFRLFILKIGRDICRKSWCGTKSASKIATYSTSILFCMLPVPLSKLQPYSHLFPNDVVFVTLICIPKPRLKIIPYHPSSHPIPESKDVPGPIQWRTDCTILGKSLIKNGIWTTTFGLLSDFFSSIAFVVATKYKICNLWIPYMESKQQRPI